MATALAAAAIFLLFRANDEKNRPSGGYAAKGGGVREKEEFSPKKKYRLPSSPIPSAHTVRPPVSNGGQKTQLPPDRRRLLNAIESAYDADDLQKTLELFEQARNAPEPEIRSSMVWSLGWFGRKALPQLTEFLSDADAEVSNDALGQWDSAIQEVTDEKEKIRFIEDAMSRLADPAALEDVALEYSGLDEKGVVESLIRVLTSQNEAAVQVAKETYETVTGRPFTSMAAAYQLLSQMDD